MEWLEHSKRCLEGYLAELVECRGEVTIADHRRLHRLVRGEWGERRRPPEEELHCVDGCAATCRICALFAACEPTCPLRARRTRSRTVAVLEERRLRQLA